MKTRRIVNLADKIVERIDNKARLRDIVHARTRKEIIKILERYEFEKKDIEYVKSATRFQLQLLQVLVSKVLG